MVAVGTVKLGSIVATHYTATIKKASGSTKAGGVYNVWVGQDGYIHRVRTTIARHLELQHRSRGRDLHAVGLRAAGDGHRPAGVSDCRLDNGSIPGLGG